MGEHNIGQDVFFHSPGCLILLAESGSRPLENVRSKLLDEEKDSFAKQLRKIVNQLRLHEGSYIGSLESALHLTPVGIRIWVTLSLAKRHSRSFC